MISYLGSEWSFASCNVLDKRTVVAFTTQLNTLIAISYEGKYLINIYFNQLSILF